MTAILVVEDEVIHALAIREEFQDLGVEAVVQSEAEGALRWFAARVFDAAVIDVGLPGMSGDVLARECRRRFPDMPIVLATGLHERDVRRWFEGDSKLEVLEKPYDFGALCERLRALGAPLPVSPDANSRTSCFD